MLKAHHRNLVGMGSDGCYDDRGGVSAFRRPATGGSKSCRGYPRVIAVLARVASAAGVTTDRTSGHGRRWNACLLAAGPFDPMEVLMRFGQFARSSSFRALGLAALLGGVIAIAACTADRAVAADGKGSDKVAAL